MKQWLVALPVLSLLLLVILPACGGGGKDKTPTPTLTATTITVPTAIPTTTPVTTVTPTSAPSGPVKIGAINAWSGPMAMSGMLADQAIAVVEKQVKDQGGILGGREVKVIKYDNRGVVAEAVAGALQLLAKDHVSVLVFSGAGGAELGALADFAEEHQILYVAYGGTENMENLKFTISATTTYTTCAKTITDFTLNYLNPKTVGFLGIDMYDSHAIVGVYKPMIEAGGVKTVYEEYTPVDTTDYSSFLTKIKYANPDVLITYYGSSESYMSMAKQMAELGGWSNIKVIATVGAESSAKLASAQGWYVYTPWFPRLTFPGAVKFEQAYMAMFGKLPGETQVYYYNCLWAAIHAIELAGTDTDLVKIAEAARSGKLEWDAPQGRAHYTADGDSNLMPVFARIENKMLVPVEW